MNGVEVRNFEFPCYESSLLIHSLLGDWKNDNFFVLSDTFAV